MYTLTIPGAPIVKKNTQRVVRRGNRIFTIYSSAYTNWVENATIHLDTLKKPTAPIDFPINLQCKFYRPTRGTVDLSALYEGIQDVLVKAGWLADDNWLIVKSHDGSGVFHDKDNPRMEIKITKKEGFDEG